MAKLNREYIHRAPEFRSDGEDTVPIPTTHVIDHLLLRVDYGFTVTGGTDAGAVHADAAYRIAREIVVRAGNQELQRVTGSALQLLNHLLQPESHQQTPPSSTADETADTDRQSVLMIPIGRMGHARFGAGQFAFPPLREPRLTVRWARGQDLVTSDADGAAEIVNASTRLIEVFHETPASGRRFAPLLIKTQDVPVVATGPMVVDLDHLLAGPTGGPGMEVRAVLVEGLTDGVGGRQFAHHNDVVKSVKLMIAGLPVRETIDMIDQRQVNKEVYGLENLVTGAAIFDAAEDENVTPGELWTVQGRGENSVHLDVEPQGAGENRVRITTLYTAGRFAARPAAARR